MYTEILNLWREKATEDADLIHELDSVIGNEEEISDRFYKHLEFGTAGLRGIIGAGTNRMNVYTVGRVTQAISKYVNSISNNASVAIGYDSRIKSELFAKTAAGIFAANGLKVYIYKELMPTPMLSYAVRKLGCAVGVVITASHNPAKYNGYKAYGPDGCQLTPEACEKILSVMSKINIFEDIKFYDFDNGIKNGKIEYISDELISGYYDRVQGLSTIHDEKKLNALKVIYTPLHGAGNKPIRAILDRIGIKNVYVVKEQEMPDGNFPTTPFPNPEFRQTFEIALSMTKNIDADILLATDPDCDRVGIAVKQNGQFRLLSGNDVGVLLLNYMLSSKMENGTLPENPVAVKTIVSTELTRKVAEYYGCNLIDVLTGFKYIGEQIALLEDKHEENRFILGFEESYGYLAGTFVRDKDAVIASMLICEMVAYYKEKEMTLFDVLDNLYEKFGYFKNLQKSVSFEGMSGQEKIDSIMLSARSNPPHSIAGYNVISVSDYLSGLKTEISTGKKTTINLPKSNVIKFTLNDSSTVIIRPSGTEPKVKFYLGIIGNTDDECNEKLEKINSCVNEDGIKQ